MILYLTCIIGTGVILTLIGSLLHEAINLELWIALTLPAFLIVLIISIDGLFAFLIRRLPTKWFSSEHKIFSGSKGECRFYEKIGIKKWKEKVPELGGFTSFHKDKISKPSDPSYLERFILEANYGVLIHLSGAILGYLIFLIPPYRLCYMYALPVSAVNMFLNLLPMMILRYNLPKLQTLLTLAKRRESRSKI